MDLMTLFYFGIIFLLAQLPIGMAIGYWLAKGYDNAQR